MPPIPATTLRRDLAVVAAGGCVGTWLRFLPTLWWSSAISTLVVNLVGSFLLGLLTEVLAAHGPENQGRRMIRLALGTGLLGGFTTYSTMAILITELSAIHASIGILYALTSITMGIFACALGIRVSQWAHLARRHP